MSILTSKFQVLAGLPPHDSSALRRDIQPKAAVTLTEGNIVDIENVGGVAVVDKMTSTAVAAGQPPNQPWLVIEGNDQGDGATANRCTCLKLGTGFIWQIATAESSTIGDRCRSLAGVLKPLTGAYEQAIGEIIGVNTANGTVVVSS